MKKFFSFVAAALMSVAMFAELPAGVTVPNVEGYRADGANVLVAIYVTAPVCGDIVFVGSYNGWSGVAADCAKFEAVEGAEGWYVVSVSDASEDIQGKPVHLKLDGSFSWDFQAGAAETISGAATVVPGQYSGEIDIKTYGTSEANVLMISAWKNGTPCVAAAKHDYTVLLHAPFCADAEGTYFDPAIIGDFNGWSEGVAMNFDDARDAFVYSFNDEEKHTFKFRAAGITDWSNQIQLYNAEEDSWYDNGNITLGTEETIELDYSEGRYTLCVEEITAVENVEVKKATKVIENGQLILVVDGVRYNTVGAQL